MGFSPSIFFAFVFESLLLAPSERLSLICTYHHRASQSLLVQTQQEPDIIHTRK